jgi:hypothetical protein
VSWFVLLDAVVALLLAATIVYAVLLNRKLGHLRGNRSEIEQTAVEFNEAIAKAEASVAKLKVSTDDLRLQVGKAQSLKEDLTLLIARGDAVADVLEEAVRAGRKQRDGGSRSRSAAAAGGTALRSTGPGSIGLGGIAPGGFGPENAGSVSTGPGSATPRTEAERELLRALASGR